MAKTCPCCQTTKDTSDFYVNKHKKDGYSALCKVCQRASTRRWIDNNKEKNAETKRKKRYLDSYGITIEEYEDRLKAQNGVCALCKEICITFDVLCVDHDHDTGKVRGLLCNLCNRGIGLMRDDPKLLRMAANYIEEGGFNGEK